jgi:aldehyde dehydrogenase (NAD+)
MEKIESSIQKNSVSEIIKELRKSFNSKVSSTKEWRYEQLKAMKKMIKDEEKRINEALYKDLRKPEHEVYAGEISTTLSEINEAKNNLSSWMYPISVSTPLFNAKGLSASSIQYQPLGVVLIIAPWNYPFNLLFSPLVGAIAAGNCVLLKPSELAPATSELIAELVPKYLDNNSIKVIEGGADITTEILKHKFNHIFYTGNPTVARIVMKAASEFLCPITLELGGKNPCFVDSEIDLEVAARRIAWGKSFNSGQTCLSVDYAIVKKSIQDKLIKAIIDNWKQFYGENPKTSSSYPRIINKRHVSRIGSLLQEIPPENIVYGGQVDEEDKFISPTIIKNVSLSTELKIMQEEIFGPILPIIAVDDFKEAVNFVNSLPSPLSIYVFSKSQAIKSYILENTISGGAVCNDVMVQFAQNSLPFGGVGESGMGSYHGKKSFLTFSNERSVLDKTTWFDIELRYPPYSGSKLDKFKQII